MAPKNKKNSWTLAVVCYSLKMCEFQWKSSLCDCPRKLQISRREKSIQLVWWPVWECKPRYQSYPPDFLMILTDGGIAVCKNVSSICVSFDAFRNFKENRKKLSPVPVLSTESNIKSSFVIAIMYTFESHKISIIWIKIAVQISSIIMYKNKILFFFRLKKIKTKPLLYFCIL